MARGAEIAWESLETAADGSVRGHAGLKPSAYTSVLTHQRRERCN